MKKIKTEYLCAAISILLWASISPVTKLLLAEIDTMQIVFIGSIFALIFVIIVSLIKNKRILPKEYKPKDYFCMSVTGLCGIFFYQLFFCLATYRLPAQEAFIINYLWPIMTVVFACLLLKEKLTFTKALGLALSFAGVIIVLTKFNLSSIAGLNFGGAAFALLAAISYGLFCVLGKKHHYDELYSMTVYLIVSIIVSGIWLVLKGNMPALQPIHLLGIAWLGIFTSAIPLILWEIALSKGNTAVISNLAFITPFLSLVYIYFILHEPISIYSLIGLVVIVCGVFVQMKKK